MGGCGSISPGQPPVRSAPLKVERWPPRPTDCGVAVGGGPPGVPGVALPARYAEAVPDWSSDTDGCAIPLKVKRKPSDALVTTVLRAHFRKLYGEHKSVSIGGGVLVVGARHAPTASKTIENKPGEFVEVAPIETSDEEDVKRGGFLVVGPKATAEELEELARRRRVRSARDRVYRRRGQR